MRLDREKFYVLRKAINTSSRAERGDIPMRGHSHQKLPSGTSESLPSPPQSPTLSVLSYFYMSLRKQASSCSLPLAKNIIRGKKGEEKKKQINIIVTQGQEDHVCTRDRSCEVIAAILLPQRDGVTLGAELSPALSAVMCDWVPTGATRAPGWHLLSAGTAACLQNFFRHFPPKGRRKRLPGSLAAGEAQDSPRCTPFHTAPALEENACPVHREALSPPAAPSGELAEPMQPLPAPGAGQQTPGRRAAEGLATCCLRLSRRQGNTSWRARRDSASGEEPACAGGAQL